MFQGRNLRLGVKGNPLASVSGGRGFLHPRTGTLGTRENISMQHVNNTYSLRSLLLILNSLVTSVDILRSSFFIRAREV